MIFRFPEQEEGWLMGIKEATGRQGLFPANFTRPIWAAGWNGMQNDSKYKEKKMMTANKKELYKKTKKKTHLKKSSKLTNLK